MTECDSVKTQPGAKMRKIQILFAIVAVIGGGLFAADFSEYKFMVSENQGRCVDPKTYAKKDYSVDALKSEFGCQTEELADLGGLFLTCRVGERLVRLVYAKTEESCLNALKAMSSNAQEAQKDYSHYRFMASAKYGRCMNPENYGGEDHSVNTLMRKYSCQTEENSTIGGLLVKCEMPAGATTFVYAQSASSCAKALRAIKQMKR